MGFSISWIGFKGLGKREILDRIGFRDTGTFVAEAFESPFAFARLPTGWSVVSSQDVRYAAPPGLGRLSAGTSVLGVQIEEHVMVSVASLFEDGRQVWLVAHGLNADVNHLVTEGRPPSEFDAIRRRLFALQATEQPADKPRTDFIFDIPVELAEAATGYRHDRPSRFRFTALATVRPARWPWLRPFFQ